MGELFIWQHPKGLSLGSESDKGGGGGGCSLKEPQHLFHAVGEMERRGEQLPPPLSGLWLILFHTAGNPGSSSGALAALLCPRGSCRVLSNNSPACSAGFLAMRTAQALIHGLAECRENGKDIAF